MEDIVYVVVLLLISAIPAIQKGIQKRNEQKKRRVSVPDSVITNVNTSDSSAITPSFASEPTDRIKAAAAPERGPILQQPGRQYEPVSCQSPETPVGKEQPEQTNGVWDDFDLRKAVIYSEILRPKF